jgi:hypothetical protein
MDEPTQEPQAPRLEAGATITEFKVGQLRDPQTGEQVKMLVFSLEVILPLPGEAANELSKALASTNIQIATAMPHG